MAAWTLVPCLVSLRGEFNRLAPKRGKASDGSVGDTTHAGNSSDHNPDETGRTPSEDADSKNEVHAIDVDKDLNCAGWSMERAVQIIVTRHRAGADDRLQNVIYNRRIWSRSWGWTARPYTGTNAHTEHAHFSARYTTAQEADTKPWGLLAAQAADEKENDVALADDMITITADTAKEIGKKAGDKVSAATLLQLALIHSKRAAVDADAAEKLGQDLLAGQAALDLRLKAFEDLLSSAGTPSSAEQTAALLHAVLGPRSDEVGRLLAAYQD
jgi:hypothetical protein